MWVKRVMQKKTKYKPLGQLGCTLKSLNDAGSFGNIIEGCVSRSTNGKKVSGHCVYLCQS